MTVNIMKFLQFVAFSNILSLCTNKYEYIKPVSLVVYGPEYKNNSVNSNIMHGSKEKQKDVLTPYSLEYCLDSINKYYNDLGGPFHVKKIPCGKFISGQKDCFVIAAGKLDNAIPEKYGISLEKQKEYISDKTHIESLLYYAKEIPDLKGYIDGTDVDFAVLVMSKDPKCTVGNLGIDPLAPTIIGPGSVSLKDAKTESKAETHSESTSIEINPLFFVDIPILSFGGSMEWSKSTESSYSKAETLEYKSLNGGSATPVVVRTTRVCQGSKVHIIMNRKGKITEKDVQVENTPIPDQLHNSLINNNPCSVDYVNSNID